MPTVTGEAQLSMKPPLWDGVSSFLWAAKVSRKPNCGELSYVYSWFSVAFLLISVHFSRSVMSDSLRPHELPVHHQLPEFTQTHVHRVSDAIQPSHPLSSTSPPAPNPSQHQSLFQWVNSSHQVAKVLVSALASILPMNTQDWSPLGWTGWISLQSKGLSRVFSNTTAQMHQFFGAQLSSQSNSHIHTWLLEKP